MIDWVGRPRASLNLIKRNPPAGGFPILIERASPPREGFVFTMFPDQEPCVRGPPSKDLYQVRRGGSSYTRLLIREHSNTKPPRGGGFLS